MLDQEDHLSLSLQMFYSRLARLRILREHHLWESVRLLFLDLSDAPAGARRRLDVLFSSDAMLDAVMLLAALSAPRRYVNRIDSQHRFRSCSIRVQAQAGAAFRSAHQDLAAAVHGSLILSYLQSPISRRATSSFLEE